MTTADEKAWRVILWGGYQERVFYPEIGTGFVTYRNIYPLTISKVQPTLIHRIHKFLFGRYSVSLWIRGPITHKVELHGKGCNQNDQ